MASHPNEVNPGQFIGTTQVYDLGNSNINAEDFTVRLRNNFNAIVMSLNTRDSGYYSQEEYVNGQLFYPDYSSVDSYSSSPATFRQVYRKVIDCGALPDTATKTIAHGITFLPTAGNTTFVATRICGAATNPAGRTFLTLPYSSPTLNLNVNVFVNATNILITTGVDRTAYTKSHIVIEYCKY